MLNQIIQLTLLIIASIIVMILHELPKAIIYANTYNQSKKSHKKNVFALYQYIDPIGLVFCLTQMAGFSKPYVHRLNDKKLNRTLGITGFASLLFIFILSMVSINLMEKNFANLSVDEISLAGNLFFSFIIYMASISMGMFLVNLFPIATFDMGMLIASQSSDKYYSVISNDYVVKVILLLFMLFKLFSNLTFIIINLFIII